METPKSNSKCIKPRKHLPTPKMSERKKALFTSRARNSPGSLLHRGDSDEDSDLGVMSPLQCSSSPTRYDFDDSGPFSFTNIMTSKYCLHDQRNSHNIEDEYEIVSASNKPTLIEQPEEIVLQTPTKSNLSNAWIDMTQVLNLSAPITLLTPHRTSIKEKTPQTLFTKSMIAKDADITPHAEDHPDTHSRSMTQGKDSKARTSLFNEGSISTKSFYSLNATSNGFKGVSQSSSILPLIRKTSKPISYHKQNRATYRTTKRNEINRGVFHKIQKQRTRKTSLKRGIVKVKKEQLLKASIDMIDKPLNASTDKEKDRRKHQRVQELLKNMVDPIELARPLNIDVPRSNPHSLDDSNNSTEKLEGETSLMQQILNSSDPSTSSITKNRKFFKTKTHKRAKYEVMKGVSAYLDQGKLFLEKQAKKSKKRKLHSLFDDDLEFDEEHQEVDDILKSLTDPESNKTETPLKELHNNVMSSTQISNLASKFAEMNSVSGEQGETLKEKVFPLFEKGQKSATSHSQSKTKRIKGNEWRPIGDDQLQIDAGQKAFGAIECKTCQFIYTQHVPEDEQLHQQFHNSCQILNFKGWEKENRVLDIYEWGVSGRIISVSNLDSKVKVQRTQEILKVADMELGFGQNLLHPSVMIYLACNNKEVMGLCVAQPLSTANKLISDFGIDFCSSETYDVKCGISRIWVNAKHRRKGVASKLLEAVKCHFVYGCRLSNDEIAFSAPTEAGKAFAEKVMGKKDFLVYQ